MKILFLGTSAGWPLPRLGCNCEICQSKDPKDKRLRPAILINGSILVDAGPDIYHQILRFENCPPTGRAGKLKIENLKTLVLTHAHPDHILGFYDLTHIYNRQEKNPTLIATQETVNGLQQTYLFPLSPFKLKIVRPKEPLQVENLTLALLPVYHNHTPTFAVKVKERRIMIYMPDLSRLPKSERRDFRGVHLLILDGSCLGKKGHTKTHQSIDEGIRLAKDLNPKLCYFTHIGHITGTHQQLENYVQKNGGKNFHIAWDGLELEI